MMSRPLVRLVGALAAAGIGAVAFAQTPARLVPAGSEISFVSKQMGVPVEGHFKKFDALISLDPKRPDGGNATLHFDVSSATLGVPEADAELPKPAWFSALKFPRASFQSHTIKGLGAGRFEVAGKLDLKGQARELVVPVVITHKDGLSTATGSFMLKRLEFKIGEGEWADTGLVANDVQVRFKLVLTGLGAF